MKQLLCSVLGRCLRQLRADTLENMWVELIFFNSFGENLEQRPVFHIGLAVCHGQRCTKPCHLLFDRALLWMHLGPEAVWGVPVVPTVDASDAIDKGFVYGLWHFERIARNEWKQSVYMCMYITTITQMPHRTNT